MKSFDLCKYTLHTDHIIHHGCHHGNTLSLVRDNNLVGAYLLRKKNIFKPFDHDKFWKIAGICTNEEELLKEFEKMLDSNFKEEPVKFPLDKDLECPAIPKEAKRVPKDGDAYELHSDHDIVTASAGGNAYKYCRDCKVEIKDQRVFTGTKATLMIDGKPVAFANNVSFNKDLATINEIRSHLFINTATEEDLERIGKQFGLTKHRGESNKWFQKRLLEHMKC